MSQSGHKKPQCRCYCYPWHGHVDLSSRRLREQEICLAIDVVGRRGLFLCVTFPALRGAEVSGDILFVCVWIKIG